MSKINIPFVPKPTTLKLFDAPIAEAQDILKAELAWLNYSFGKSQRLVKKRDNRSYNYPGVYITSGQYVDMLPTTEYGNYSFFIVDSSQDLVEYRPNAFNELEAPCSIVFWFDLSQIYTDSPDRAIEVIKAEILEVLTRRMPLKTGQFRLNQVQEKAEDIYREYSIAEIESQFLMQPFCGLRFNGTLRVKESC